MLMILVQIRWNDAKKIKCWDFLSVVCVLVGEQCLFCEHKDYKRQHGPNQSIFLLNAFESKLLFFFFWFGLISYSL